MSGGKKKGGRQVYEKEDVLQAVILADSFNTRFAPLTANRPRVLLPIANTTLLDYTLEFLATNHVREVFILCCAFAEQIKAYVDGSRWAADGQFVVKLVNAPRCLSVGEAMKEIDATGCITSDFVLVTGDVVSNLKLAGIIEEHKARVAKDKDNFMTMILQEASAGHRIRPYGEDRLVAIDKASGCLLAYSKLAHGKARLPLSAIGEQSLVQLRYDLVDTGVYICTPEVPVLFTDNFDYRGMLDLIKGILQSDETSTHRIFTSVTHDEYGARVSDIHRYDAVCKDILNRWVYPLVPDSFQPEGIPTSYKRNHLYLQRDVILSRSCVLDTAVLIGSGCRVGVEGGGETRITRSTIGRNCTVGADVSLEDVYLWDDVEIGSNVRISKAILGFGVRILDNVVLEPGCIVSDGVVLGPDLTVPAGTRFSCQVQQTDDGWADEEQLALGQSSPETEAPVFDAEAVGAQGRGFVWSPYDEYDEDLAPAWGVPHDHTDTENESESSGSEFEGETDQEMEPGIDDFQLFYEEVHDVIRARVDKANVGATPVDSVALEISGSRSANEMGPRDVVRAVVQACLAIGEPLSEDSKVVSVFYKKVFITLGPILRNYAKSIEEQVSLITAAEDAAVLLPFALPCFQTILHTMYDADTLDERALCSWYEGHRPGGDEVRAMLHKQVTPLIDWLRNAESESSSEESESE